MKCSRERESNNANILRRLKPSKDDAFMLEQSCKDFSQGFCSQPMGKTQLLSTLKGRRFRLIPRCVITQANGKQRIIDDAARGGQSELCSDQNKLVLCTPLRPAQHIAAVGAGMPDDLWNHCCHADQWLGAGEDWLNSGLYRHSPIRFDEALACVVVFWHDEWQEPLFRSTAVCCLVWLWR